MIEKLVGPRLRGDSGFGMVVDGMRFLGYSIFAGLVEFHLLMDTDIVWERRDEDGTRFGHV
jgi:hypothetical protein